MAKKRKRTRPSKIWKEKTVLVRNFVAKHLRTFNKPKVHKDKTKYTRKAKYKKFDL